MKGKFFVMLWLTDLCCICPFDKTCDKGGYINLSCIKTHRKLYKKLGDEEK